MLAVAARQTPSWEILVCVTITVSEYHCVTVGVTVIYIYNRL